MTDTSKDVKLTAGLDVTDVTKGTQQINTAVRDMAGVVKKEGEAAAKGVSEIGDGAEKSAKKLEQADSRIIASIQRRGAVLEAAGKGEVAYQEALLRARGRNPDDFRPYLDKLGQIDAAQKAATGSLDKMGISAKQTAAALRGVPAQFTDIVTSLQGGQAPLTVLLQQGGQLKDMFGGAGAAARALGGFVLGLVNPFTIAAAAAGGLAYAYKLGSDELSAFQRTLTLSGNAAGVSAGQLNDMAASVAKLSAGTQGRAAEILAQMAGSAAVGSVNMERFTAAAIRFEAVGGPAAEETAKAFADLAKSPLEATLKLNEGTNFLTKSVYEQIKALTDQGRTVDAARVAQEAYASALESRAPQMLQNLGSIERAWLTVKEATKAAADSLLSIGRSQGPEQAAQALRNRIASVQAGNEGADGRAQLTALQAQLQALQQGAKYEAQSAFFAAERAASVKAGAEWDKESDKYLSKRAQQEREIAKAETLGLAAGRSRADIEQQIAAIRAKYAEKPIKISANSFDTASLSAYAKGLEDLGRIASSANTSAEGLSKTQGKLRDIQADPAWATYSRQQQEQIIFSASLAQAEEDHAAVTLQSAKAIEEANKSYAKWRAELTKGAEVIDDQVAKLRTEAQAAELTADGYTSLEQAIQLVEIARLEEQKTMMQGDELATSAVQREINARRELIDLIGAKDAREAAARSAKDTAAEWKRSADSINQSLTDALLRGFESGKDFAQNLRDTVVNMFKTLVLRPIISAIVNPVAGALTGALGFSGAASAAGSAASGANGLGSLGSLAGISGSLGAFGTAAGYGASALFGGTGLAALSGGASMVGAGSIASGLGMMAGVVGPIALGLLAVTALLKDKSASLGFGASTVGANGSIGDASRQFGFGNGNDAGAQSQLSALSQTVLATVATAALGFGGNAAGLTAQAATDIDRKGKGAGTIQFVRDGQRLGGVQTGGSDPLLQAASKIEAGKLGDYFAGATSAAVIAGLQQSDLSKRFAEYFSSVSASSLTKEQADAMLEAASAAKALGQSYGYLGGVFSQLDNISVQASEQLLKVFGGLDGFSTAVGGYLQNFYSEAERSALATKQLSDALGGLGVELPATREAYRALVDAQDLTTEGGRNTYAALLQLSPAFASLVEATAALGDASAGTAADLARAAADMAEAGRKVLADLASEAGSLNVDLLRAQGNGSAADALQRQRDLAALTGGLSSIDAEAAAAAYDLNSALRQQIEALSAAADAESELLRQREAVNAQAAGLAQQIMRLEGDTAGLRAQELAALDPANRALQERINALQDAQAADQRAAAVAGERAGLEQQLLQLQGDTAGLRAQELAALDPANRALQERINALADEKARLDDLAQAGEGIAGVLRDILAPGGSGKTTVASLRATYQDDLSAAMGGNVDASGRIATSGRALLDAVRANANSPVELARETSRIAAQLQTLPALLAYQDKLQGTLTGVVGSLGPALDLTSPSRVFNGEQVSTALGASDGITAELRAVRAELAGLREDQRAQSAAIAANGTRTVALLKRFDADGLRVKNDADTPLTTAAV